MLISLELFSLKCYALIVCFYIFNVSNDPFLYIMKKNYIFSKYIKNILNDIQIIVLI